MEKILVLEDSAESQFLVEAVLGANFSLSKASTVAEADRLLERERFDLILVDIELPDGNGFDFCERLRRRPESAETPVIVLTGKSEADDKVRGFSLGADDYLVKPFEPRELRARIDRRLRNARARTAPAQSISAGDLTVQLAFQKVNIARAGAAAVEVSLTPIEYRILLHLVQNADRDRSREQILEAVQAANVHVLARTIDKHVCSLREKLEASNTQIKTVFRVGYRFTAAAAAVATTDVDRTRIGT